VIFSGTLASSTNKTDHLYITEIVLKVTLNTITQNLHVTLHHRSITPNKLFPVITKKQENHKS